MNTRLHYVTAESVRRGHTDKYCDQIADRILDAYLEKDPNARVAVEVMATDGEMLIAGEITSSANVNVQPIVKNMIRDIGYAPEDVGPNGEVDMHINLNTQSPDIARAVTGNCKDIGAGDQGIVVGYATDETPEMLPLPVVLAHRICHHLDMMYDGLRLKAAGEDFDDESDILNKFVGLRADGKAQVTVLYDEDKPIAISAVVGSFQHEENAAGDRLKAAGRAHLARGLRPIEMLRPNTRILLNPSERFVKGGPTADTGLTGRKLAVDMYGTSAHIGGGALSGKDPTKTDRSGAYAARWVAKNIVAAGLARRCEVQIAYAIGKSKPISVSIDTFGTGILSDDVIEKAVNDIFDLRPAAIIEELMLRKPVYSLTSVYGHFGHNDMSWENVGKRRELLAAAIRHNS